MFDEVTTKVRCPYCNEETHVDFRPEFGRIVKAIKCCCGRYYVVDFEISLSKSIRGIDGL